MNDYIKLVIVSDGIKAAMIKGILEEHDIPATIINKQDSNYVFLGENEIWVPEVCIEEALEVLKEIQIN